MQLHPYVFFAGQCEEAFGLYSQVLGGTITSMLRYEGIPPTDMPTPPGWDDKIMHASIEVGGRILMASDVPPDRFRPMQGAALSLGIAAPDEAERVFAALGQGGVITMPITQTFWASRFGMLTDRFGIPWMVNCDQSGDAGDTADSP